MRQTHFEGVSGEERGSNVQAFAPYVDSLTPGTFGHSTEVLAGALNDGPSAALRTMVPLEERRRKGTFFTSKRLAEDIWADAEASLARDSVVIDPACGAGDLLLPVVHWFATNQPDLDVPARIRGTDVEAVFVRATRERLKLALPPRRGQVALFEGVREDNFLEHPESILQGSTHVVLNPPFSTIEAPPDIAWAKSSINAAALFVDRALTYMPQGARLLAILPDVLRSGSRYQAWRDMVLSKSIINAVRDLGQFDTTTDVHVFLLDVTRPGADYAIDDRGDWGMPVVHDSETIGDKFRVNVGSVVPHRDEEIGNVKPYLTAKNLESWVVVKSVTTQRRYGGRTNSGPFVVVRRTSRPGETHRARATLITDTRDIAVENHLVVLTPLDGKVSTCESLMKVLANPGTSAFLDERIRCRHLTVGSVKEIPWTEELA